MPAKKEKFSSTKDGVAKLNETGNRKKSERRKLAVTVAGERRKTPRRRQIDPTTCEREYNEAEIEFMQALDDYKRRNGRMFPTCSEVLEVLVNLGYQKNQSVGCEALDAAQAAIAEISIIQAI